MTQPQPDAAATRPAPTGAGPLATVVVLNWNGRRLLPDCLDALAKQDLDPARWQTWVVDNGSTDDSLKLLARDYPQVHVVANTANLGFAGGNNVAMRTAPTPFVVLLNNDAYPEPDWLRRLLAVMQAPGAERIAAATSKVLFEPRFLQLELDTPGFQPPADPRQLGALVARVRVGDEDVTERVLWDQVAYGPEQHGGRRFRWTRPTGTLLLPLRPAPSVPEEGLRVVITARGECAKPLVLRWPGGQHAVQLTDADADHELRIPAGTPLVDVLNNAGSILHAPGYGADRGYQQVDTGHYDTPEDVFLFCGAAVCLRTQALREVGVFDDDFFMYYEDTDLSWRFHAAGWRIRYAPEAVARHLHSASAVEWSPFFTFHVERNRLLTLTKNAPARLAAGQVARFGLTTLSMARWALLQGVRDRRRPAMRPLLVRARVAGSYLRLLPKVLARRQRTAPRATNRRELLDRWLQAGR